MSENEFYNRINADAAARVTAQRELEEIREANLRRQEEEREALAAEAQQLHRSTRVALRRRRAVLRSWRRILGCASLAVGLYAGHAAGLAEAWFTVAVGLYTFTLIALEEVGK